MELIEKCLDELNRNWKRLSEQDRISLDYLLEKSEDGELNHYEKEKVRAIWKRLGGQ